MIYRAKGCDHCNATGYEGRRALLELVEINEDLQKLIHDGAGEAELDRAIRQSVPSIYDEGYYLVAQGITSVEEVLRVTTA